MSEFTVPRVTADDHVRGHAGAAVTVLEYGDYECPYCRGAARDVHLLLDNYPETVRFVFRNFPIRNSTRTRSRPPRQPRPPPRKGCSGRCTSSCCSPPPTSIPTRW